MDQHQLPEEKNDPYSQKQKVEAEQQTEVTRCFLDEDIAREQVNVRLPVDLVDWLTSLATNARRAYGEKIPKERWHQAAIELMLSLPVNWEGIKSIEHLRQEIEYLSNRINELYQDNLIY